MKMGAEIGLMCLQGKEHQIASPHQRLGERPGTDSPVEAAEGINLAGILVSDF